eukprot:scaffold28385_cov27-Tisochrysis_lutea.AAC.2
MFLSSRTLLGRPRKVIGPFFSPVAPTPPPIATGAPPGARSVGDGRGGGGGLRGLSSALTMTAETDVVFWATRGVIMP